jgi:MFS superfamily sulfate permease-like transporter
MAIKEVQVCDICEEQKDVFLVEPITNLELCERCKQLFWKASERAEKIIQARVNFSVGHRLSLLSLLERNDSSHYWGSEGLKLREQLMEELRKEG